MRRRPLNTKPWLVQVKRKAGGRIQNLLKLRKERAKLAQLRAEPLSTTVLTGIVHTREHIDYYRRQAHRSPRRAWINGGAHYCYCMECGKRNSINNMVSRKNVDMANRENYCIECAQRKGIEFWTRDQPIPNIDNYDFYI